MKNLIGFILYKISAAVFLFSYTWIINYQDKKIADAIYNKLSYKMEVDENEN